MATMIPELLNRAFLPQNPGAALPPGPRENNWPLMGSAVGEETPELGLCRALWWSERFHHTDNGQKTTVRQRPVPSAGAAYPAQSHLLIPAGSSSNLVPGRYFYSKEGNQLRHSGALVRPALSPGNIESAAGSDHPGWLAASRGIEHPLLLISVLPGRTFSRYRHRAWTLWIADAAYALAAAAWLISATGQWTLGSRQRIVAGFPAASDLPGWAASKQIPELVLGGLELRPDWQIDPQRKASLASRRSPQIAEFVGRAGRQAKEATLLAAVIKSAAQDWLRGAERIVLWIAPEATTAKQLWQQLWSTHLDAATLCYHLHHRREWRVRPVSGFTAVAGEDRILHALALLPEHHRVNQQGEPVLELRYAQDQGGYFPLRTELEFSHDG